MSKYLDYEGLGYLWDKIKAEDAQKGGYIEYDENAKLIKLWASEADSNAEGKSPLSTIDASVFIKDGMLDDVDIIISSETLPIPYGDKTYKDGTKFIGFTWNTDAGTKKDYLKLDEIGKVYTGSDSINISTDNKISVSNIATAKITQNKIVVEGGPLETYFKDAGITEIDSNMDMATLLLKLACKEKWPANTSFTAGGITASLAAPEYELTLSGTSTAASGTIEVGTKVTMGTVTIPDPVTIGDPTVPKVSGFSWGYSAENDDEADSSSSYISATMVTGSKKLNTDNYTMEITFSGFTDTNGDDLATIDVTSNTDHEKVKYEGPINLLVAPGSNAVKATITGPKALVEFNDIEQYYAVSNLGNTTNSETGQPFHLSTKRTGLSYTSSQPSNNLELTVTGKYKYFFGYSDIKSWDTVATYFDSAKVRALTTQSGYLENSGTKALTAGTSNGKSLVVAFPSTYKLSDAKYTDGSDMLANFSNSGTVNVACGANADYTTAYTVMVFPVDTGAEIGFKDIKITKK